jgi:hypothetical protein
MSIIKFIDSYLEKNNLLNIDIINANALLAKVKLLSDSKDRPGKPLRELLRKGRLPHAYQSGGAGTQWVIPHSSRRKLKPLIHSTAESEVNQVQKPSMSEIQGGKKENDTNQILLSIAEARLKYKPQAVKCLIIVEAPPDSVDRFFYFEDVKQHDYLFLGIAEALYPKLKSQYLQSHRSRENKIKILNKLAEDGFYLMDLSDLPLSLMRGSLEDQLPGLMERISIIATKMTWIILIKANVYDIVYSRLVGEGYKHVANVRIPFPGQGWQNKFQIEFKRAFNVLDIKV